jgi:hypothetical protein
MSLYEWREGRWRRELFHVRIGCKISYLRLWVSPLSSIEVKNAWSYISTPQYICMAWYLVKKQRPHLYDFGCDTATLHETKHNNSIFHCTLYLQLLLKTCKLMGIQWIQPTCKHLFITHMDRLYIFSYPTILTHESITSGILDFIFNSAPCLLHGICLLYSRSNPH